MTSTIEKLIGLVETLVSTIVEIRTSQVNIEKQQKEVIEASKETNKINKEILEQLKEINTKMDTVEEPTEEEPVNEEPVEDEPKPTSQDQMNAFFNMMMNTMQAQTEAVSNESSYNEYPGYNDTSKPDEIEAIAERIRNNAAAQEKLNGNNFSSLDNFDYDTTFGGSSFNQNNEKPPEQPVYHRVEAQPYQMNLDGVFNNTSTPTGNNWYGTSTQQKEYKLGLSPDRQSMIFRRIYNGEDIILPPIHKGSIAWNTIENKLKTENRRLSSLTNKDLSDLSEWMNGLTDKGIDVFTPTNQNAAQVNNNDLFDTYHQPQVHQPQVQQPQVNINNPYNQPTPTQDISRRNMTSYNSMAYNNSMSYGYTQPTNSMWAHYGEDIINNSSTINQPQPNFTNGGYTNPYNVKPVFSGNSFNIYGG